MTIWLLFESKGVKSISMHSKSNSSRSDSIKKLKKKEIDILFCVDFFNEGVDIPAVDTILMARPTESKIIFLQQFGRGLRKAIGKEKVTIIDFIGNHKTFLDKPSALLGFDFNYQNFRNFLKDYEEGKLKTQRCRILYDTESVDLMKKLSETKQDYLTLYSDYIVKNGERPSASEFHQFIDKLSQIRLNHSSWFGLKDMNDLNEEEKNSL